MIGKYVFPVLTALLVAVTVSVARAQQPVIVESEKGGLNNEFYSEASGTWEHSVAKSTAPGVSPISLGSRYLQVPANTGPAEARVSPVLPADGEYEIAVTWGRSANAQHVKYVVDAADGAKTVYLDQDGWGGTSRPNPDQWFSLGVFKLPAKGAVVHVSIDEVGPPPQPKNAHRIYVDAFRFAKPGTVAAASGAGSTSSTGTQMAAAADPSSSTASIPALTPKASSGATTGTMTSPFTGKDQKPIAAGPTTRTAAPSATGSPFTMSGTGLSLPNVSDGLMLTSFSKIM